MEWGRGSSTPNSQRMRKMYAPDTLASQRHMSWYRFTVHPEMGSRYLPAPLLSLPTQGSLGLELTHKSGGEAPASLEDSGSL